MGKDSGKSGGIKIYATLFWEFFKIGIFTIGGGMAMIPQIQQLVVQDKKWMDEDEMLDCIAISQSMPAAAMETTVLRTLSISPSVQYGARPSLTTPPLSERPMALMAFIA